jgi:nicotinamidase-related amidase
MSDLHGSAPDRSPVVLVVIDVINDLEWPGGDRMLPDAIEMARRIAELKRGAAAHGVATVYVNDNFGRWKSDFRAQVAHCLEDGVCGQSVVELVLPSEDDYFVLKPMHSGFFGTSLDLLLRHLEARTLVLTGIAANNCVLMTANDAYMHGYQIVVPSDAVVSNTRAETEAALEQLRTVVKAATPRAAEIDFARVRGRGRLDFAGRIR